MTYSVQLSRDARRYFDKLPQASRRRLAARIDLLSLDPFDPDLSKPLHGGLDGLRTSRVGDLRIIFEVRERVLLLYVVRIGPRGDVYRG